MFDFLRKVLSHDCGPFWQFVKYGVIGVMSTVVQVVVFYLAASTLLPCLTGEDWAVRLLHLPAASVSDAVRGLHFVFATAIGFVVSNIFCWIMNRAFVFRAGKYAWYKELALFAGVAALAMAIATALGWVCIHWFSLMTTLAVFIEILVSFVFNYFLRKFVIFKG